METVISTPTIMCLAWLMKTATTSWTLWRKLPVKRTVVEEIPAAEDNDEEDGEPMVTHSIARCLVYLLQHF